MTDKTTLANLIACLPVKERMILSLHYEEELSFDDIARVLDIRKPWGSPDPDRVRRMYILAIQKVLGEYEIDNWQS